MSLELIYSRPVIGHLSLRSIVIVGTGFFLPLINLTVKYYCCEHGYYIIRNTMQPKKFGS